MEKTKICTKCRIDKPLSEYYMVRNSYRPELGRVYYRTSCKTCWKRMNVPYHDKSLIKHHEKNKARRKYLWALTKGVLTRKPCVVCGDEKAHGHHEDYSKPLEVIWLCRQHHEDVHHKGLKV